MIVAVAPRDCPHDTDASPYSARDPHLMACAHTCVDERHRKRRQAGRGDVGVARAVDRDRPVRQERAIPQELDAVPAGADRWADERSVRGEAKRQRCSDDFQRIRDDADRRCQGSPAVWPAGRIGECVCRHADRSEAVDSRHGRERRGVKGSRSGEARERAAGDRDIGCGEIGRRAAERERDGGRFTPVQRRHAAGDRDRGSVRCNRVDDIGGIEPAATGGLAQQRPDWIDVVDEPALQLGHGERRVDRQRKGRHARHVGRRHARAAQGSILVAGHRAVDVHARGGDVDRRRSVIAEPGQRILVVGRCHADDRGRIECGRVARRSVRVGPIVARRRHEHDAGRAAGVDGVEQASFVAAAPPTIARDPHVDAVGRPHHRRVVDGPDGVGRRTGARRVEEFERHQRHIPVHPGDAGAVVPHAADRARHVRAVVVVVHRVAVVVCEVVPVHVVHEAVVVIVHAVAGNLARIGPDVGGQIGMGVVDAGVDHGYDGRTAARRDIPRLRRVDVGVGRASRLPDVVEAVEIREGGIVGKRRHLCCAVATEGGDSHVGGEILLHRRQRSGGSHEQLPRQPQPLDDLQAQRRGLLQIGCRLSHRMHAREGAARQLDNPLMDTRGVSSNAHALRRAGWHLRDRAVAAGQRCRRPLRGGHDRRDRSASG